MHSALVVIENLIPGTHNHIVAQIKNDLEKHPEIKFLSGNVLLIPSHLLLLAISSLDLQCRSFQGHVGQNLGYKCLFLEEEPEWIYSKELLKL
jgi:hypothetical protein